MWWAMPRIKLEAVPLGRVHEANLAPTDGLPPIALRMVIGREDGDCAVAALATYLGLTYEDVLRVCARVDARYDGKSGLHTQDIRRAAKILGHPLRRKKRVDLDEDHGVIEFADHVAVLWHGLIFDPDGRVWEHEDFLKFYNCSPWGLLYR